jgi:hypothetical protein
VLLLIEHIALTTLLSQGHTNEVHFSYQNGVYSAQTVSISVDTCTLRKGDYLINESQESQTVFIAAR